MLIPVTNAHHDGGTTQVVPPTTTAEQSSSEIGIPVLIVFGIIVVTWLVWRYFKK